MARRRQIFEGKAKILYEGPEPGTLVQYFKDESSALNVKNSGVITGKGVLNNRISEYLMTRLGEMGIPTHFVRRLNMREQLVREVEMIPLEVIVRNFAAGSFAEMFRMSEGTPLPRSIVEYYYKSDELSHPMVSEEHVTAFGWATPQDLDEVMSLSLRINDFLSGLFLGIGMRLMDLTLEFGRLWEDDQVRIVLADEICPELLPAVGHPHQPATRPRTLRGRLQPARGRLSGGGAPARHPSGKWTSRHEGSGGHAVKHRPEVMQPGRRYERDRVAC